MKSFALLLLLLLIGCGSRSSASRLIGSWRADVAGHEGTVIYREDGTFAKTVASTGGGVKLETQGTYRVSGTTLSETITKVLLNGEESMRQERDLVGKTMTGEIKFLDDDTIENTADGVTVKMVRIRVQLEK